VAPALLASPHSGAAALLLLPYLLWSPVDTLAGWQMQELTQKKPLLRKQSFRNQRAEKMATANSFAKVR